MSFYSDDPHADFDRHDTERARWEAKRPKCDLCGETIQDDYYYDLDGTISCTECLEDNYRKMVEDYVC